MIIYLTKTILCLGLFALLYKALLEKERMHRFNRFFLLSSLIFSFFIPLISFNINVQSIPTLDNTVAETFYASDYGKPILSKSNSETNYLLFGFLIIYASISGLLLLRFIINLNKVLQKAWANKAIPFKNHKLILINQNITPHSFLDFIFFSKEDYRNGNIEQEILLHELAHVKQKHSLDILFIEILQIIFWFNPFIFMYRKALLINHEFLADEAVLDDNIDVSDYQLLLIKMASRQTSSFITSQFNYLITKQRLIMMTKTKSLRNAISRQITVIPVVGIALFLFSTNSIAQDTTKKVNPKQTEVQYSQEGVTSEQLAEYNGIVNNTKNERGNPVYSKFSQTDKNRLETLFLLMTKEQQAIQIVKFRPAPPPLPKSTPTKEQIESWKNSKVYGVWINEKRVSNSVLNEYSNTDFSQLFVSQLSKNAINYGKHYYQVDLMTNEYYLSYYKEAMESKKKYFMSIKNINL